MGKNVKAVTITISHDVLKNVDEVAEEKRMSRSATIQMMIIEYIEAKQAFDSIGGVDTIAKMMKKHYDKGEE